MQGVGTEFKEIGEFAPDNQGLTMSVGGEKRVNWGITRLIDALKRASSETFLDTGGGDALVQKMGTSLTEDLLGASIFKNSYGRRKEVLEAPRQRLKPKLMPSTHPRPLPK